MRRDVRPTRPPGLGIAAFVIATTGVTAGAVLLFIAGYIYGPAAAAINELPASGSLDDLPAALRNSVEQATVWFNTGLSAYVLLALWGGILGVTAFIRRQGRRWAAGAMAVALVGFLIVFWAGTLGLSLTAG